jgi:hypothetical protein
MFTDATPNRREPMSMPLNTGDAAAFPQKRPPQTTNKRDDVDGTQHPR